MINYDLPTYICINGINHPIRNKGDYRVVLDVITALNDPDLKPIERVECALFIFFEDFEVMDSSDYEEALKLEMEFISYNAKDKDKQAKKIMDWEQDFPLIIAPINRIIGKEVRSIEYFHWFTFLSAYYEIGECSFQFIVGLRDKMNRGEKLEKYEKKFIRENKELVELNNRYSVEEQALLDSIK